MDNKGAEMRQQMDETLAGLNEKLGALESQVSGTVKTVQDSVETVRSTFDLKAYVHRRPWTLLAGATVLGFLCAFRLSGRMAGRHGGTSVIHMTVEGNPGTEANDCTNGMDAARIAAAVERSWLSSLGSRLQPEITALRGVAMGALLELVRETLMRQAPKTMAPPVAKADRDSDGKPQGEALPAQTTTTGWRKRDSSARMRKPMENAPAKAGRARSGEPGSNSARPRKERAGSVQNKPAR